MKARWLGKFALAILIMAGVGTGAWYWLNYGPLPEVPASQYHVRGKFGPLQSWPLTPIHAVTLVDGRVMTYGADNKGQQGGEMMYDIWDPSKGMGPSSHLTLPNTVGTDIFCAAQVVLSRPDGKVLLAGGDRTVNGARHQLLQLAKKPARILPGSDGAPALVPHLADLAQGRCHGRGRARHQEYLHR